MLCHGDIFLLSRGNKNIITCQKNKSFLCNKKVNRHHKIIFIII